MSIYDSIGATPAIAGKSIYSALPTVKAATPTSTVTPGPLNNFISNVVGGAKFVAENSGLDATASDVTNALTAPVPSATDGAFSVKDSKSVTDDIGLAAINSFTATAQDTAQKLSTAWQAVADQHASLVDKGVATGEAALGLLNSGFSPLTSFLAGSAHIPIVGVVAQGINNVFGAIGAAGKDGGIGAVNDLPISDETKAKLAPLAGDIGALTAQVIAGGATHDTFSAIGDKTNQFMTTITDSMQAKKGLLDSAGKPIEPNPITKLPVHGDTTPRPLPVAGESVETPITPNNKYTPDADLPTIQTGPSAKDASGLPSIQAGDATPASKMPGYTVEPVSQSTAPAEPTNSVSKEAPAIENAPTTPTVMSGEQAPTKVSNDISTKLVAEGMRELTPEQKATYTTGSYKDSAEQAKIISEQDPASLNQMAITGQGIPEGVHPQIAFNVAEELATKNKDFDTLQKLAKSPLATERSVHAQELGSSGFNKVSDSPVDIIKKAADTKAGGKEGAKKIAVEAKKAKTTITKSAAKMMDYQSILDAIKTC